MRDIFFWKGQEWEGDTLEEINAEDNESEEQEIIVMNRKTMLKMQSGAWEKELRPVNKSTFNIL